MKSKLVLIICSLLMAGQGIAQKIKDQRFNTQYIQLPSSPLDPSFTTYKVTIAGPTSAVEDLGSTEAKVAKGMNLDGFKRVDDGPAHFTIALRIGSFRVEGRKDNKRTEKRKGKDDKTYTVHHYSRSISYSQPFSYRIYDYTGKVLEEKILKSRTDIGKWKSREYTKYSDLSKYMADNYSSIVYEIQKNFLTGRLNDAKKRIRFKYDFQKKTNGVDKLYVLGKKADQAEGFVEAYETVKTAFAKMKATEPLGSLKEEVTSALTFWKNARDQYSPTNKKEKKAHYACLYNLAKVYYWLDDVKAATAATEAMQAMDYKDGQADRFMKDIKTLKRLLEVNGLSSRHLDRQVENAVPPPTAKELEEIAEAEEAESALVQYQGQWTSTEGNTLDGTFYLDLEQNKELSFGQNSNIYFRCASREEPLYIKLGETASFSFDNRTFEVLNYTPGNNGNTEAGRHLLEIIYTSDRVRVLKHYPFDASSEEVESEYAYHKPQEEAPVSTLSTGFLIFKKGLANYFSDCTDLTDLIAEGEFSNDKKGILKAARIYGEVCQ